MPVKQVRVEGFKVSVEMDSGETYPFRTHPEAAQLFGAALAYKEAVRQLMPFAVSGAKDDPKAMDVVTKVAKLIDLVEGR